MRGVPGLYWSSVILSTGYSTAGIDAAVNGGDCPEDLRDSLDPELGRRAPSRDSLDPELGRRAPSRDPLDPELGTGGSSRLEK